MKRAGSGLPWLIISQLLVTLGLLGFALVQKDATLKDLIVGAVIAHWLGETTKLGRQVNDNIVASNLAGLSSSGMIQSGGGGVVVTPGSSVVIPPSPPAGPTVDVSRQPAPGGQPVGAAAGS